MPILIVVCAAIIVGVVGSLIYQVNRTSRLPEYNPNTDPRNQNPLEYAIKANHIYHFMETLRWPETATPSKELVLGIIGEDPFGPHLEQKMKDASIGGKSVKIVKFKNVDEINAHVLFVASKGAPPLADVLKKCSGKPIVTIGESKDFLKAGGMINFELKEGRIQFSINQIALQGEGFELDAPPSHKTD